ncbi:MAG: glycosyltransferase family 39 protein [Candidatus Omnitrophica bacterium]|nr:glycosyltransferase family 39 protein [Candidatus Omnitrophota bacterium]
MKTISKSTWILGAICAAGFLLRCVGLGFGLPELYHADEPIVVNHAMAYGTGDFNPHFFQIPPLVSYLFGKFPNPDAFADLFFTNPTSFYLAGRFFMGVIPGTLTILAVYGLARRLMDRRAALWAALLMAVCFGHVRDSHYIYTDIPLTLALVAAVWAALRLWERGSLKDYVLAGAMVGLCTAIKYNAALVGGAYAMAHLLRQEKWTRKIFSGRFWLGVAACLGVFIGTNPFCVLDFSSFWQGLSRQGQAQTFVGWTHHLSYSLAGAMGPAAVVAALAGMGLAAWEKRGPVWIVLGFIVPFYFGITFFGQHHDRYVLPLIPFLTIFLAFLLDWLAQRISARRWVVHVLLVCFALTMLAKSAYSDWLFCRSDSRTLAKQWIEAHIPAGTKIALDHTFYAPRLQPTLEQLREKLVKIQDTAGSADQKKAKLERLIHLAKPEDKRYNLFFLSDEGDRAGGFLSAEPRIPFDYDQIRRQGIKVVVSHRLGPVRPHAKFFKQVWRDAKGQHRFSPYRSMKHKWPSEPQVRTGGAFLWKEMLQRYSNGEYVIVYVLR